MCILSSFLLTRIPGLSFKQLQCSGKSPGPHKHKHTTDWTIDMLPQRIFSSVAWTRVIGHNCHRLLKARKTMATLCEDTEQFNSTSADLLMLSFFPVFYLKMGQTSISTEELWNTCTFIIFLKKCWIKIRDYRSHFWKLDLSATPCTIPVRDNYSFMFCVVL